ncbi:MAG: hypothetical protein ACR2RE_23680 [Geminicoccaceae bacterium]
MKAVISSRSTEDVRTVGLVDTPFAVLFLIVAVVITAPLAVIDTPLLADYPNHVARMHVLGNLDDNILLSERYAVTFDLIPNIAMDFAVPRLARWMSLDLAGRIFLGACLVLSLASVAFLHRILFNQWYSYSLLAAFFVYHGSMMVGMANFSLGIGLVPGALALWIRMLEAHVAWRLLVGCMMTLLLYFCHLVAVGAFGILIIGHGLAHLRDYAGHSDGLRRTFREFSVIAATGLLPLVLFLSILQAGDRASAPGEIVYGNLAWKLKALLSPLANYHLPLDLISFALLLILGLALWWRGWLVIDRRLQPGLALLAAAFVVAPKALWTGGLFDQRLAVLLALMLVASTHVKVAPGRIVHTLSVVLALLFLVRMSVLTSTWLEHRDDLAEMHRAIDLMSEGGRILVVQPDEDAGQRLAPPRHRVLHHAVQLVSLPALAVVETSAFVSSLYAIQGQQPLALKPPYDRLGGRGHVDLPTLDDLALALRSDQADTATRRQIQTWTNDFDYIVMIYGYGPNRDARVDDLPIDMLLDGAILDLFRVVKNRRLP